MKYVLMLLMIAVLNSCGPEYVNLYRNNYESYILSPPKTTPVENIEVKDYPEYDTILKHGYVLMGQSNYMNRLYGVYMFDATTFGKDIGSDKVLTKKPTYHHSATATYTSYNVTRYNISGNSNGNGNVGNTYYRYNSNTNLDITAITPTTEQYTYGVYLFSALYLKKIKYIFGAFFREFDTTESNKYNAGIVVKFSVKDSPADVNEIYPNDIIISVNDNKIYNIDQMNRLETKNHDSLVTIKLIRKSDTITKTIQFN